MRVAPPEALVSGYMFGKSIYFADISTKSANYCAADTSGNVGLLLLCEVELGRPPLERTAADCDARKHAWNSNRISTLGVGQNVPPCWKDAACVHQTLRGVLMPDTTPSIKPSGKQTTLRFNEYIVYDEA